MRTIYLGNTLINDAFLGSDRMSDFVQGEINTRQFIMEVNTAGLGATSSNQFRLPTEGSGYNFQVNWGDGVIETYTGSPGNITHTYPSSGVYDISITGEFPRIYFNFTGDREKLTKIKQWGDIKWFNFASAFDGCKRLVITAADTPDLSNVEDMSESFRLCDDLTLSPNGINNWDVSNVTNMAGMFANAPFNLPIGNWDVSNVTDISGMFAFSQFNQPIGNWDVSNVTDISGTFYNCPFNQDIGNWNVSNVTNMSNLFNSCPFNQNIGNWNTTNVTNMAAMFANTSQFNQNIGNWNTTNVTQMQIMFYNATAFNQNLSGWCVELIATEPGLFDDGATSWVLARPNWGVAC